MASNLGSVIHSNCSPTLSQMLNKLVIVKSCVCTYSFNLILDTAIFRRLLVQSIVSGSLLSYDTHVCASGSETASFVAGFTLVILVLKRVIFDLLGLDSSL